MNEYFRDVKLTSY